jgi:undecaprenyl diphosphate synthase
VYAFSHENWKRESGEVSYLMTLLQKTLVDEVDDLVKHGVRVSVMGDLGMVTKELRHAVRNAEEKTKKEQKAFVKRRAVVRRTARRVARDARVGKRVRRRSSGRRGHHRVYDRGSTEHASSAVQLPRA